MIEKQIDYFNIGQICDSGECFRMTPLEDDTYRIIAGDKALKLTQKGRRCIFRCSQEEFQDLWEDYFDLKADYSNYMSKIDPSDEYLMAAAEFGSGIRILNQDLWEMIVSFLISQQNNIVRIRKCIENISHEYGAEMIDADGEEYYAFPKPEALANLNEDALKTCNLGYRSKYVVRAAQSVVQGTIDLDAIREMPYEQAHEELLKIFGVGVKVADCICLFALHHLDAFPVDTHINQALQKHYRRGFPRRRYKGCRGVLQQYVFYYELKG